MEVYEIPHSPVIYNSSHHSSLYGYYIILSATNTSSCG